MPFLSLAAPIWLCGLLLLPLIRWLHRGGPQRRALPVSRLALWRGAVASSPAGGERRPPDPAWRRRALLAALLSLALAEPQWPGQRTQLTLWVDDSLSMLTREAQGTRLAVGLAQARALLAEAAPTEVDVRTLGDPWRALGALDEASVATILDGAGRGVPAPPPPALLRRQSQQWLLTDGADAVLRAWPGDRQPDRVIQVASVTRNVGLERLSARRHLEDPDQLDLLLKVTNGGSAAETRTLVWFAGGAEVARSTLDLAAGTSALVRATIPTAASVRATLQPGDALAADDEIVLDLAPLRRLQVAVDSTCPPSLLAAVAAHPALALAPTGDTAAQAVLDCGGRSASGASRLPMIRVLAEQLPRPLPGVLLWSAAVPESGRIRLDGERLRLAARLQPQPADAVLLSAGDAPLIVGRAGAVALVETAIDFSATAAGGGPELALLVDWMFSRLQGRPLLDATAITDRGLASSRVVPAPRTAAAPSPQAPTEARFLRTGTQPLLILALLVLLWEIVALAGQWRRQSAWAEAPTE